MPNPADPITDIFQIVTKFEGSSKATNDPSDKGGRTQYGISEKANPKAWADGKVTEEEAREIFVKKYVIWPGYHQIPPTHRAVQAQLIDFGYLSGPGIATQKLQLVLGLVVDGDFGPKTLAALVAEDPRVINNRLMCERIKMLGKLISNNPSQAKFAGGWLNRAIEFLI